MPLRRPATTSLRTSIEARTVVVGWAGAPRRAMMRPRSITTVQFQTPPELSRMVADTSARTGEYLPRSRRSSKGSKIMVDHFGHLLVSDPAVFALFTAG